VAAGIPATEARAELMINEATKDDKDESRLPSALSSPRNTYVIGEHRGTAPAPIHPRERHRPTEGMPCRTELGR
jgi:hypothetical protein